MVYLAHEPPAESPLYDEQFGVLRGLGRAVGRKLARQRERESSTPLRRVISRAPCGPSRALGAWVALPMMRLAGVGFSSRYSARPGSPAFCSGRISVAVFVFDLAIELRVFVPAPFEPRTQPAQPRACRRRREFESQLFAKDTLGLSVLVDGCVTTCLKPSRCVPPSCVLMLPRTPGGFVGAG